ncbi:tripartite tricarboxylate transporter substrate binding protein [Paraburkholderia caffeinilytica]|uniref:tripartite tricarboxylate transporter substrate binding protein n=1 Tax=Paraburkholderia caffeinilytica TaxID=1761016 RepID=UPI0038BC87E0
MNDFPRRSTHSLPGHGIAFAILLLTACLLGKPSTGIAAGTYPDQPVRIVVPYPPGGGTDLVARVMAQQLSQQTGQSFIVENRPGGGSSVGAGFVARSAPDGYTLLMADTSFTIVPSLHKSVPYSDVKDFTPISEIMQVPEVFVVNPSVKAKTVGELVALARNNPGKLNYGSAGVGSIIHLSGELFKKEAKVDLVHIPYKGGGDMAMAGISGQVQMLFGALPTLITQVKSGQLRPLAVTTSDDRRSASLPDVPSMNEAGVPNMNVYVWFGLIGPAHLPDAVVTRLHDEITKALRTPFVQTQFRQQGGELVGSSPAAFAEQIRTDHQRWADVIKAAGIPPQ